LPVTTQDHHESTERKQSRFDWHLWGPLMVTVAKAAAVGVVVLVLLPVLLVLLVVAGIWVVSYEVWLSLRRRLRKS
jgi:Flp pilus assembly protein TadB